MQLSDKVMFEIYREGSYNRKYRVVYFTELDEHSKETEINRALAGDHFFDGFLKESELGEAKLIILSVLARLNDGEQIQPDELETLLADHMA
jgi:hypothetical protein